MYQKQAIQILSRLRQSYYDRLDDGIGDRAENKKTIRALATAIHALARPTDDPAQLTERKDDKEVRRG